MIESLLSHNTLNKFRFIMSPTLEKTCGLRCRTRMMTRTFTKTKDSKDCSQHTLVTYAKRALKVGRLLVTVRVLKVQQWFEIL